MNLLKSVRSLLNVSQEPTPEQASASNVSSQQPPPQGPMLPQHRQQSAAHNLLRFRKIFTKKADSGSPVTGRTEQPQTRRSSVSSQLNADFETMKADTLERLDSCLKFDWAGFAERNHAYGDHATEMHGRLEDLTNTFKHVISMQVTEAHNKITQELNEMRPKAEHMAKLQTPKPKKERFGFGSRQERLNVRKNIVQDKLNETKKERLANFNGQMEKTFKELEGSYRKSITQKFNMYFKEAFPGGEVPREMTELKADIMRLAEGVSSQPSSQRESLVSQKNSFDKSHRTSTANSELEVSANEVIETKSIASEKRSFESSRRSSVASIKVVPPEDSANEVVESKPIDSVRSEPPPPPLPEHSTTYRPKVAPENSGPRPFPGRESLDESLAESWLSPLTSGPTAAEVDETLAAFAEGGAFADITLDPHIEQFLKTGKLPDAEPSPEGAGLVWKLKKPEQGE
jgi:hypothetical protein